MSTIEFAYNRFCTERFPLPSEKQVAEFEERIGVPLPPDYREFLLQFNGGLFSEPEIRPPSNKDCPVDRLTYLRGLGAPKRTFELAATVNLFDDNYPAQILPIGYTLMGNLVFVVTDPTGDDYGALGLKIASSDQAFDLGDNLEEFFESLQERHSTHNHG